MKEPLSSDLISYGRWLMALVTGQSSGPGPSWLPGFTEKLGWPGDKAPVAPLQAILTLLDLDSGQISPAYLRPTMLRLGTDNQDWALFPVAEAAASGSRDEVGRAFMAAAGQETDFDRFFYLMRRFASTLPNTYGEPGVSLFEQWKIVAALAAIAGGTDSPPTSLGLVKGDIPGIQRTINTISSKGAAKGMRGRSAFIQLLGDALVRRLLDDLQLSLANVVYDAGGNFVLLTGWEEGEQGTAAAVQKAANDVNTVLLRGADTPSGRFDGFHGDLSVALAAMKLADGLDTLKPIRTTRNNITASLWQHAESRLNDALTAAKNRPFGELAKKADGFGWLFNPEPAETDDVCAVCRRLRRKEEPLFRPIAPEDIEGPLGCPECRGFNDLANDMGHGDRMLVLSEHAPGRGSDGEGSASWQIALYTVSRLWYTLERREAVARSGLGSSRRVLALEPDHFDLPAFTGFRWLAHTTPMVEVEKRAPDGSIKKTRAIKSNDVIAADSRGMERLGVLRMDVDNLGDLIVRGLPKRTPMQTAELSQTLERFFAGWLDRICKRIEQASGKNDAFYVLFAGGDDLFVIGPWDLMPLLATAIQKDFSKYANEHPAVHLSGGIAVVSDHAPMHQAAEESHTALSEAKGLDRGKPTAKNAITFLGHTFHWDEFTNVEQLQKDIVELADKGGLGNAVITRLLAIERRYRRDCGRAPYGQKGQTPAHMANPIYYGPWMWQQAYAFARFAEGQKDNDIKAKLRAFPGRLINKEIPQLGLAARWAQWLRKGA